VHNTWVALRILGLELCQNTSQKDMVTTKNASILLKLTGLIMLVSSMVEDVGLDKTMINMVKHPIVIATCNAKMTQD
jgi:hypothetical protein